ncbi:uncharacterized protein LOC126761015 [Bactrocera neohumeralis]|uniref:uncharacterized protein LOC126761015 n=2 Tax=Bactrocera tyroni species complex TaxID=98808 RepID=UPI002165A027|nr:uncharacterized protein LOC126761015 [Bactrocera neohumeralis]
MTGAEYLQVYLYVHIFICTVNEYTMELTRILVNLIITVVNFGVSTSSLYEEKGAAGQTLPKAATFHFPEYAYKETSKNEILYHEFETACERNTLCENLEAVMKKSCVRRCISYTCYQDIYGFDELEEGEIDVRLNSFKGCVIQRTGKNHRRYPSTQGLLFNRFDLGEFFFNVQWKLTNFLKNML